MTNLVFSKSQLWATPRFTCSYCLQRVLYKIYSQAFSSNDTGCRQAEGPLYPDEKSDKAKYDDNKKKSL